MWFIQVSNKVACPSRGQVVFWIHGDVQMVTFVSKEGCNTSSGAQSIIVSEFCQREEFRPIVLLIVAIDLNVLFQGLICSFSLSVGFGVITRGEMELHIQSYSKRLEEVGYKLGALVGSNVRPNTMFKEYMYNK